MEISETHPSYVIYIADDCLLSLHRSEFKPKYNGKDRFLIRCFGMLDEKYQRTSYARPDNNIMFSAIYS